MGKYNGNSGQNAGELKIPHAPAWMVTYGDIMTLLLTFFVLLISYSTIKQESFRRALESFQEALGLLPYEQSVIVFEQPPAVGLRPPPPARELAKQILHSAELAGVSDSVKVAAEKEGVRITIQSPVLFDSGKADLRPEALPVLDEITNILAGNANYVVVEGHTDNVPIHTEQFPSNWELSAARAISVARYLFQTGDLDAGRFTVAGYGEYHPVSSNETPGGRQDNRRVEIFLRYHIDPSEAGRWQDNGRKGAGESRGHQGRQ